MDIRAILNTYIPRLKAYERGDIDSQPYVPAEVLDKALREIDRLLNKLDKHAPR